ncbi:hypothetical protein NLJ89_g2923 [Agrocybe chaxingu]|uniref:F-box domain-containing protein n=1 Tax=Agrocybe chaxingu TaxID=84603 RepID=A0A9W8K5P2_9AGAR|nr:hypothetical protein NLJ89_g2923 [Agrocybe chaxingu]
MPSPRLPLELLYAIISHLGAKEDYASLRACASTCRALVPPAQAHIFRSLTLNKESRTRPWLAKLESTPHIRITPRCCILKHVEEISLRELDPEGQGGVMHGDNSLPTFLNHFPNLQAITFGGCWVQVERAASESGITAPVFRLERLYIDSCYDALVLDWLVPALSSLKILRLAYCGGQDIFSAAASPRFDSLEHVDVRGLNEASDAELRSLVAAVKHTVSLRSITTINSRFKFASENSPIIEVVVQFLLLLGAHRYLQHLAIGFFEEDDLVRRSPWDELQDLLLGGRFPALQSVKFVFWSGSSESNPVTTEPFFAAVPRLVQKKMVSACYYR